MKEKQTRSNGARMPVALVTGGAQGIGLASAEALVRDGFDVVLADIQTEKAEAEAQRIDATAIHCDMGNPESIHAMFKRVESDLGPVRALVNNAGVALPGEFLSYDLNDFERVISVNLIGSFVALQRAARAMIENEIRGAIVNMSSINAQVAIPAIPAYCASKGGVMQLTKSAALALAPFGIRVNAIGPGSIDTEMMAGVNASPAALETALSRTPLGRIGATAEVGNVVAFLVSDRASYITGETIYVDGGRLALNYTC